MEETSGAFRKKKVYFTQVSNNALRDKELSLKAKGLYSLIQSFLTIENFTLYKNNLRKYCDEGDIAFESTWKEIKKAGYLIQYRLQNAKKHFYYEYELLDIKDIELANKTHSSQNRKTKEEKSHTPKTTGMDKNQKPIPHVLEGMGIKPYGIDGGYTNTYLTNTDLTNTNLLVEETIQLFESNICKLKTTTKNQFIKYCTSYDIKFIKSIISLCAESGTLYFSGFKIIINEYIGKNIITNEALEAYVTKYREESKKLRDKEREKRKVRANKPKAIIKTDSFNDYPQRQYNFDDLEKKLLGWDK